MPTTPQNVLLSSQKRPPPGRSVETKDDEQFPKTLYHKDSKVGRLRSRMVQNEQEETAAGSDWKSLTDLDIETAPAAEPGSMPGEQQAREQEARAHVPEVHPGTPIPQYVPLAPGFSPTTPGVQPPTPVLTVLDPNTAAIGTPSFTLSVKGTGFDEGSVIVFNGVTEPTTFVSATEVTTGVNMDVWLGPSEPLPIVVRNAHHYPSNVLTFTFTEESPMATTQQPPSPQPPAPGSPTKSPDSPTKSPDRAPDSPRDSPPRPGQDQPSKRS